MTICSISYRRNGSLAGVATIDLSLKGVEDFLKSHGDVTGGYAFAINRVGSVLYFPGAKPGDQLQNVARHSSESSWLSDVLNWQRQGSASTSTLHIDHVNAFNSPAYVSMVKVAGTGWVIGVVTPEGAMTAIAGQLRSEMLLTLVPALIVLFGILWLAGRSLTRSIEETTKQIQALGSRREAGELSVQRPDEIGALRVAVNEYAGRLQGMLESISKNRKRLNNMRTRSRVFQW